jgi:hypothetical protein
MRAAALPPLAQQLLIAKPHVHASQFLFLGGACRLEPWTGVLRVLLPDRETPPYVTQASIDTWMPLYMHAISLDFLDGYFVIAETESLLQSLLLELGWLRCAASSLIVSSAATPSQPTVRILLLPWLQYCGQEILLELSSF